MKIEVGDKLLFREENKNEIKECTLICKDKKDKYKWDKKIGESYSIILKTDDKLYISEIDDYLVDEMFEKEKYIVLPIDLVYENDRYNDGYCLTLYVSDNKDILKNL